MRMRLKSRSKKYRKHYWICSVNRTVAIGRRMNPRKLAGIITSKKTARELEILRSLGLIVRTLCFLVLARPCKVNSAVKQLHSGARYGGQIDGGGEREVHLSYRRVYMMQGHEARKTSPLDDRSAVRRAEYRSRPAVQEGSSLQQRIPA